MKRTAALVLAALVSSVPMTALADPADAPAITWEKVSSMMTPIPTATPQIPTQSDVYYARARTATDLRTGPGVGYDRVGSLNPGEVLLYLDAYSRDSANAIWYMVQYGSDEVWVSANDTDLEYGALPATAAPVPATPQPVVPTAAPTQPPVTESSIGVYYGAFTAEVSSYRPANQNEGISVSGDRAIDGNLLTAWNSFGESSNQWLRVSVNDGRRYQIAGLRIAAGYWKTGEVYYANNRPKEIDVYCDGAYVGFYTLSDTMDYQTIRFSQPVVGASIQISVRSMYYAQQNSRIYPGGGSKDCCVTEVELIGPASSVLVEGAMDDWGASVQRLRSKLAGGGSLARGSYGMEVIGLQLLLRDGFGVLNGAVDGVFGSGTLAAVDRLADAMRRAVPDCEYMPSGVVDGAYWRNMMKYMETIN